MPYFKLFSVSSLVLFLFFLLFDTDTIQKKNILPEPKMTNKYEKRHTYTLSDINFMNSYIKQFMQMHFIVFANHSKNYIQI